jgi:ferritin-like metal-binding protein YciE
MSRWVSLEDALLPAVQDLFDAERQQLTMLPKVAAVVSRPDLSEVIHRHLDETRNHVARLEQVLAILGEDPRAARCAGIAGIIDEATSLLEQCATRPVRDALIIGWMQRAEHYEISAYGTAAAWADALDHDGVASLLRETLAEEKDADETLTILAEADVNECATASAAEPDAAA